MASFHWGFQFYGDIRFRSLTQSTFGEMAVDRGRLGYDRIAGISGDCDTCMT